jgi:hypothetical protein
VADLEGRVAAVGSVAADAGVPVRDQVAREEGGGAALAERVQVGPVFFFFFWLWFCFCFCFGVFDRGRRVFVLLLCGGWVGAGCVWSE